MKILMYPHKNDIGIDNGLGRVIHKYFEYLPQLGIKLVNINDKYDLQVSHAGATLDCDIQHNHGIYWSSYQTDENQQQQNARIIQSAIQAKAIIVPSQWVAETFKRDMRISPFVIPHAIEYKQWQHDYESQNYVLWNKNRTSDACTPQAVSELAMRFPKQRFVSTFTNKTMDNISVIGRQPFAKMKPIIQHAHIYLATNKETFGIGVLEALASGIPVLGFDWGGTSEIVTHLQDGYLVKPNDHTALTEGLEWLLINRDKLTGNCKATARKYNWLDVVKKVKEVYKYALCI